MIRASARTSFVCCLPELGIRVCFFPTDCQMLWVLQFGEKGREGGMGLWKVCDAKRFVCGPACLLLCGMLLAAKGCCSNAVFLRSMP